MLDQLDAVSMYGQFLADYHRKMVVEVHGF